MNRPYLLVIGIKIGVSDGAWIEARSSFHLCPNTVPAGLFFPINLVGNRDF